MKELFKKIFTHPFWGARVCPFSISRSEVGVSNQFIPCCEDWLTDEYKSFALDHQEKWNSDQAVELRRSMYDGSFKYCKTEICKAPTYTGWQIFIANYIPLIRRIILPFGKISLENIFAVLKKEPTLPKGPVSTNVTADISCNLACSSCRSELITTADQTILERANNELSSYAPDLKSVLFAGGEVFYSSWMREKLAELHSSSYPKMEEITVMTNALLFKEQYRPEFNRLKKVFISIDAATSETFRKVRGGSFKKLQENLEYIKELKLKKTLSYVSFHFVVRKSNYLEMEKFVKLAKKYQADRVFFQTFMKWPEAAADYKEQAVHLPSHPLHNDFLAEAKKIQHHPLVMMALPI